MTMKMKRLTHTLYVVFFFFKNWGKLSTCQSVFEEEVLVIYLYVVFFSLQKLGETFKMSICSLEEVLVIYL